MADGTSPAPIDSSGHGCDMPFRFLDLSPGMSARYYELLTPVLELRNHVYSYATDPGGPRLYYLHLTQVCRQLRSEFRPHYLSNTWMEEHIQGIQGYLDAMVPQWRMTTMLETKRSRTLPSLSTASNRIMALAFRDVHSAWCLPFTSRSSLRLGNIAQAF